MSDGTINLISSEEIKGKYLHQFEMLSKALEETINVLKALGVTPPPISFLQSTNSDTETSTRKGSLRETNR